MKWKELNEMKLTRKKFMRNLWEKLLMNEVFSWVDWFCIQFQFIQVTGHWRTQNDCDLHTYAKFLTQRELENKLLC